MAPCRHRDLSARQRRSRPPCPLPGGAGRSRAVEIARQRFYDHRSRLLCEVDVAELWAAVGPCLAVHRAELHALLREAADDESSRTGLAVERLAQRDGIASVEFSDGTSGEYDLVVGAQRLLGTSEIS
jgi:FAD-dependent urate hydroxylase